MIKLKGKQLSPAQQHYQEFAQARQPQTPVLTNSIKAFVTGGTICTIGQGIQWFFMNFYNFDEKTAGNPTVAVLIILSVVLTSMGIYDHIAQWGGAGSAVPVYGLFWQFMHM